MGRAGRLAAATVALLTALAIPLASPATAEQNPTPAECISVVTLGNGSFESPIGIDNGTFGTVSMPPWSTDDPAGFEIWRGNVGGVTANDGVQFLELDSTGYNSIWQTVATTPGETLIWQLAHRARDASGPDESSDTMRVSFGASKETAVQRALLTDGETWGPWLGFYVVPPGQTSTTMVLTGVSSATGPTGGNFLDGVSLSRQRPCVSVTTTLTDNNGGVLSGGDTVTVTSTVASDGKAQAGLNTWHSDLPSNTTYVDGTTTIDGVPVTDAAGDDTADASAAGVDARLGTDATAAAGGRLNTGESAVITYQVTVNPLIAAGDPVAVTPTASYQWSGVGVVTSTSNTPSLSIPAADLRTEVEVSPTDVVVAGSPLGYAVRIHNQGPDDAGAVSVVIAVPTELTVPSITPQGGDCAFAARQFTCIYPSMASGATVEIGIEGVIAPSTPVETSLTLAATATGVTGDPVPGNNSDSAAAAGSSAFADLTVGVQFDDGSAAGAPAVLSAGALVTFRVVVSNPGPSDAKNVVIVDAMPTALTSAVLLDHGSATCLAFGRAVVCSWATLPVGASEVLTIQARISSSAVGGDMVANAMTVTSDTPDVSPVSGAGTSFGPIVGAAADLGTGVALTSPVVVGEPITYQVVTSNAGPADAVNVVVVDALPEGVSGAVGVPDPNVPGGACSTVAQTVTCTYPALAVGRKITTTLTGVVDQDLLGGALLSNTATSHSSTADLNSANDAAATVLKAPSAVAALVSEPVQTSLARTGAQSLSALPVGLVLIGAGALLTVVVRLGRRGYPN